jgi:ABC-type bacteriocin/lantibiotic exporter with double-glycine peptidase domain
MPLLAVSHHRQLQQADCLAACAAMLLDYLYLPIEYGRLVQLLGIAVNTGPLTYWADDTAHALVVVGVEQDVVWVNDPEFEQAPQAVPLDDFLLAWLEHDYRQALIQRSSRR